MNVNIVHIAGRLTRDVEVRSVSSGTQVANIGIAINRKWSDKSGEKKEETTFVDCEAWGKTAEVMAQYLSKGSEVFVSGRLRLDLWDDKDGSKRSKMKVVVDSFQFVGGKQETDEPSPQQRPPARRTAPAAMNPDDLPF